MAVIDKEGYIVDKKWVRRKYWLVKSGQRGGYISIRNISAPTKLIGRRVVIKIFVLVEKKQE